MAQNDDATTKSQVQRSSRASKKYSAGTAADRPVATPSVYVFEKKKRKKGTRTRRYSPGTQALQRLTLGAVDASNRIADGVADGMDTFYDRSRRSSRKRRDGLIRDAVLNATRGLRDATREVGKAPYVLAKQMKGDTRRFFRTIFGYYR